MDSSFSQNMGNTWCSPSHQFYFTVRDFGGGDEWYCDHYTGHRLTINYKNGGIIVTCDTEVQRSTVKSMLITNGFVLTYSHKPLAKRGAGILSLDSRFAAHQYAL